MPYVNKITVGSDGIDLTGDTLENEMQLVKGVKAHAKNGEQIVGGLVVQHYYTGSTTPAASIGVDGDIYLQS